MADHFILYLSSHWEMQCNRLERVSLLYRITAIWWHQYYCLRSDCLYGEKGKKLPRRIKIHRVVNLPILQTTSHSSYCFPLVIASVTLFKFACGASDALHSYNYCQRNTKVTVSRCWISGGQGLQALFSFRHSFPVQFQTLCNSGVCVVFTGKSLFPTWHFRHIKDRLVFSHCIFLCGETTINMYVLL